MPRYTIDKFGLGLDSTRNPSLLPEGKLRNTVNFLHNRGEDRAELRKGILRVTNTRTTNVPIYGFYEFINNSGTTTRLRQTNGTLQSFTLTAGDTPSTVDASHQSTNIARFASALNFWLEADHRDNNYIGNGTTGYPFQIVAPTPAFTVVAAAGGARTAGTYQYDYARYSSVTGEISPAYGTAVPVTLSGGNLQSTVTNATITTTEQFDQVRIYRTKVGETGPYYRLATITVASFNSGYTDNTIDTSLTTLSTIHTDAGATNTTRPEAATDVVFHRGRIHWIGLSGVRSRHRWSQLLAYEHDSTTDARHDVDPDDGDFLWRGFSIDGALVLMKDHSIHLMNGDVDELSFSWEVASDKDTGIGAYCPFTAVATPLGIIFQGECGVYVYRPGGRPIKISDDIQDDLDDLDYSRRLFFVGGYNPCERIYYLSVTPNGGTTNTVTKAYAIDTNKWMNVSWGDALISPSLHGLFHNGSSRMKGYFGSSDGYVYETDDSGGSDGVISGTKTGTATGGSTTTITDTGASFYTSGDGLTGLVATKQVSDGSYQSRLISSNTGTIVTVASAFTTATASGDTYYVGGIPGVLSYGRIDFGEAGYKYVGRITYEFQQQSHSIRLQLGYTVDNDSQPTTFEATLQDKFTFSIPVNRTCIGISPYIRTIGTGNSVELLKIEIDYVPCGQRTRLS